MEQVKTCSLTEKVGEDDGRQKNLSNYSRTLLLYTVLARQRLQPGAQVIGYWYLEASTAKLLITVTVLAIQWL